MDLTSANVGRFFQSLDTRYKLSYGTATPFADKIAGVIPCTGEVALQGWMGRLNKMRVWEGSRVQRTPGPQTYGVAIVPFELTVGIDMFKIVDDAYGIYYPIAEFMGIQSKMLASYQVRDLMLAQGFWAASQYQIGTDGLSHWNTAHPVNVYDSSLGTYSNDFTGGGLSVNGITVGGALSPNAYQTLLSEFSSRKDESGEPMAILPDTTLVGPQLSGVGKTILQAQYLSPASFGPTTTTNVGGGVALVGNMENVANRGTTDLLSLAEFGIGSSPLVWFMLATKGPVKGSQWFEREAPVLIPRMSPQDPSVFDTHTFLWGSVARGAPGWGQSFLDARSGP